MTGIRVATVVALGMTVGLGALSNLLFLAAFQFRLEWFADPALIVTGGPTSALLFKWAALTDLFSYYLPTGVVALTIWVALRSRGPYLAATGLAAALGYVVVGGTGAAVLAMAGTPLIEAHARAGTDPATIAIAFGLLIDIVFRAVWQVVDGILLGTWMVTTGVPIRAEQPGFGRLSIGLGVLMFIGAGLTAVGLGTARDFGLGLVLVLWATWSIWLTTLVWRRRSPFHDLDAGAS